VHHLLGRVDKARFAEDARAMAAIAGPAVLTNLATPVGAAFVTHSVAQFGASAVAGQATIDRVTPVAFGLIYSLSGAVGPILSQNLGAQKFDRVRETMRASLWFMMLAVGGAWLLLALLQGPLIRAFSLEGIAAEMVHAFCTWVCASFFFAGALFVANAAFNNLGRPLWSTGFNWARATLGTIPFAWWGAHYGPVQVMAGQGAGLVIFGTLAMLASLRLTRQLGGADIPNSGTQSEPD
jgi:Na+-driven multidrug efflux pump